MIPIRIVCSKRTLKRAVWIPVGIYWGQRTCFAGPARVPVLPSPDARGRAQAPGVRRSTLLARDSTQHRGVRTRPRAESRARSGAAGAVKFKFALILFTHEGQAARAQQGEHVLFDAAVGGRVLEHLRMERRPGRRPVGNRVRARDLTRVGPNRLCLPFGRESIGAPG